MFRVFYLLANSGSICDYYLCNVSSRLVIVVVVDANDVL